MVAGRYRVVGLLGRGGMGEVYRADDLKLGQPVALKFLPEGLDQDPVRMEHFLNEVRTARQVTHPNVCRVYDIGDVDGQHFLSMEYVDGEDLTSLLLRIGRLPNERAVTVARQICAGLAAAHDQGILHRDLKPANVMIDGRGQVRLTDFGLAGLAESFGAEDARAGTPAYMAPEQLAGEGVTTRSDIYSLGLVLYELFTGQRAFSAETLAELRNARESSTPSRPSALVEGMDPAAERAVLHCLERNPQDRPASALAVSAALPGEDPLAAALAAGEIPSPELVAEAGRRDALRPGIAVLWAVLGLVLFLGATQWAATQCILHYLPLDKRPEVLIDRSQEMIAQLGFTEAAYSDPVDQAWGLIIWQTVLNEVAAADSSAARWGGLRDRPDAASFWYRQSPDRLLPRPSQEGGPTFARGPVALMNPSADRAGDVTVILDLAGRLRRLEIMPKRFATEDPSPVDWAPLFEMAGLDPARFTEVAPRYQRFFAPDLRQAWTGTRAEDPDVALRVEAGGFQGRPVLFNVSTPSSVETLANDPEPVEATLGSLFAANVAPIMALLIVIAAIGLLRRNIHRGRTDRRGAVRFGMLVFGLSFVAEALRSHSLFSPNWGQEVWPLITNAIFIGLVSWAMYAAAEPMGRRVWPTMFVSSGRLLSRPRIQWRDPMIGRSVLVALIAGSALFAWREVIGRLLEIWRSDAPPMLSGYPLEAFMGQREVLGLILGQAMTCVFAFLMVLTLVIVRQVVKNRTATLALTLILWTVLVGGDSIEGVPIDVGATALIMTVLLRWGVVAFTLLNAVTTLALLARCTELSAWYAQGAVMALVAALALAVYGVWAATESPKRT